MQAQHFLRTKQTPSQEDRRPLLRPASATGSRSAFPRPQRLFSTPARPLASRPLAAAPRTDPRARVGQENPQMLALTERVEQLTEIVKSLVSNNKSKIELPKARVPTHAARVQNFTPVREHVLLTPQVGRPGGADFMKRVNDEERWGSRVTPNKELRRIQNEYRSAIPTLTLAKDKCTTNFEEWNIAFLAYLEVLHPDLHSVCKMVSGMDFTAETFGQPICLPQMPSVPDLTVLGATSAIKNTCSAEWRHLIGTCGPHDLLPAYSALVQKFSPNSDIHRSALLASFWTRNILNHEDIDQYVAQLVTMSNDVNSKMGVEHIKEIDIISNLKRGLLANADRCDDYKTALQNLDFHSCNQLPLVVLHLKKHSHETPSAKPLHANAARHRGGGSGGRRGRGGRGRGGGRIRIEQDDEGRSSWGANYKDTYIVSQDQDGNTLVGKASKITKYCKEALCFKLLQEGKCDDPECKYRHEFNVHQHKPIDASRSRSRATLVLSNQTANTAKADDQQTQQASSPPSTGPPSTPGGPQIENGAHAFAAISSGDGYPRYIGAEYSPRGYSAKFVDAPPISISQQVQNAVSTALLLLTVPLRFLFFFPQRLFCFLRGGRAIYGHTARRSTTSKFPIIEDSGANRNMSPDRSLFVGPLVPLSSSVHTAEGSLAVATHSGTIKLDGQLLPCLYVPSFKQTMLAKSYFIRAGFCSTTNTHGRISYTHPVTQARFDFQLSDEDDLFHFVPSTPICLNTL